MCREIRKVPPSWEHPKDDFGNYKPMHDESYKSAMDWWTQEDELWKAGKHESQLKYESARECKTFAEWDGGPPDPDYHRPSFEQEPTWFQMYETVTEGTPVTPPFETKEQLCDYLVENGTFWDTTGWPRENAEAFVKSEWAPSFIMGPGVLKKPRDMNLDDLGMGDK